MKLIIIIAFVTILTSCAGYEVKSVKIIDQFKHEVYGEIDQNHEAYIQAEKDCETRFYSEPIKEFSNITTSRKGLNAILKNKMEEDYIRYSHKGSKYLASIHKFLPKQYNEIRNRQYHFSNCLLKDYGFRKTGDKKVDSYTGEEVVYNHFKRWYVPKNKM